MRKTWRDVVDRITEKESREITIDDIAEFVEMKAQASSHPISGNFSNETKEDTKEPNRNRKREGNPRTNFAINQDERFLQSPRLQGKTFDISP